MSTTTSEYRLAVERRATTGTNASHAVRSDARVPGVIYGHGQPSVAVSFDLKAFEDLLAAGARRHMITISLEGKDETVLVRDVQTAHIGRKIRHVDLLRVAANEEVTTTVPVVAVGIAKGVKNEGGVLDVIMHDVTITGPAAELPDHVDIDVSQLEVHGHVTAADVVLPEHVHMDAAPETLIASVEPSRVAETVAADEVASAEATAQAAAEAALEAAPEATADVPADGDAAEPAAEGAP